MNLSQIMAQAQKMQRELKKAKDALAKKEFTCSKNGLITITMLGNREVVSVNIDAEALFEDKSNAEILQDSIKLCLDELNSQISAQEQAINEAVTGSSMGSGLF